MGLVDAAIPGVIGLLLVLNPGWFTRAEGDAGVAARAKLRTCGVVLLAVAALYALIAMGERR